jgi:hypothetical protein
MTIIFQTAGGGTTGSVGLSSSGFLGHPPSTTFRSNAYIHRLNRTLQAETRALNAYAALTRKAEPRLEGRLRVATDAHQDGGRELVRLIIAHRGIPEDKAAISLGLTGSALRLMRAFPEQVARRATTQTLIGLERLIIGNYRKAIKLAPACDKEILEDLLTRCEDLVASLQEP